MIESFCEAGAHAFDLLRTTITKAAVGKRWRSLPAAQLIEWLPRLVEASIRDQTNAIIQPHIAYPAGLLQLDDTPAEMLNRVRPLSFLIVATSPSKRQAWIATAECDSDFCRRVKGATRSDSGATGQVRLAGTLNVKPDYHPNYPTVRVEATQQRLSRATPAEFLAAGLVVPCETRYQAPSPRYTPTTCPHAFPRYDWCLAKAPGNASGEPDRSRADFCWCCMAIRWGWTPEKCAAQLVKVAESKAHLRGPQYALYTAKKAAAAVAGEIQRFNRTPRFRA
jgi:hypothetical protein